MTLKNVLPGQDGVVGVESKTTAFIQDAKGEAHVYLLDKGGRIEVARFRNYRPKSTAQSWARFMLERKSAAQILNVIKTGNALETARRLGWKSPAERAAVRDAGIPLRYTGSQ